MTLATRCPGCGTSFRVVQDQLKVSNGWVRCGRCSEVFNAAEALFEIDAMAKQAERRPQATDAPAAVPPTARPAAVRRESPAPRSLAPKPAAAGPVGPAIAPTADGATAIAASPAAAATAPLSMTASDSASIVPEPETGARRTPAFLRQAERAERRKRPAVRVALWATTLVLAVTLCGQAALLYRDALAARWAAAQPLLDEACAWAGCRVEPLRRIGSLAVDASGLTQLEGTTIYRLAVVLRNRGELTLMVPALDLVLTDTQGRTVVRRVLTAGELGSPSRTLAAGAELPLQVNLDAADQRVAGYTIEIFYP